MRSDAELQWAAFHAFANWMETRDPMLSANDAIARKQHRIIQSMSPEATQEVLRLREMARQVEQHIVYDA